MARKIVWEKWRDPLGQDIEENEWPGAFGTLQTDKIIKKARENEISEYDDWDHGDLKDAHEEMTRQNIASQQKVQMMMTPMGMIPLTEHTRAGNVFNFWTAHTNFRIDGEVKETLDQIEGIESLDIYTQYRMRISIGKAFNSMDVRNNITKILKANQNEQKTKS